MNTALARLRAKTDRELSILIARELRRSLAHARQRNYPDAASGYERARALLAAAEISHAERASLERLLHELRARIEQPASAVA